MAIMPEKPMRQEKKFSDDNGLPVHETLEWERG